MSGRLLENWIDTYMQYTDNSEPPTLFREWCAVSAIAASLQRKVYLEWGHGITYYPNMYVVLVGPPATRKGTAMKPVENFLHAMDVKLAAEAITREALIRTLCESATQTVADNGVVSTHSSLTVFSKELTVFLGYNNMHMLSDLTDWYDCGNRWVYRTKNSGTDDIDGVFLNLIGATTPDLIRTSLPLDAIGGGLTSRIIFVYEETKGKVVPYPMLDEALKPIEERLKYDLEKIHLLSGQYRVTQAFFEAWEPWYLAQEQAYPLGRNAPKSFEGYIERRPTHLMKLSIIMAAARHSELEIDVVDLNRAISLLRRTESKMAQTFGGVGENKLARVTHGIMEMLIREDIIAERFVLRAFMNDASDSDLRMVLLGLVNAGFVQKKQDTTDKQIYYKWVGDTDGGSQ